MAGGGYSIGWELVTQQPIRRWSPEAKAKARRRNMRKRLEKKVPLFADMFEQDELARRPDYFAGADPRL
ncbi:theronine dehydrogenase [Mesorhizobium sp. L2C066B000]|uniref:theronine dehydrogenase n=1 Tax=Mesorhizobium sp. L2C066B000 TaxID=1287105 RepID=UPI001FD961FF|nr:theronine dehydrogenase [Mesorhizobium sp. L2C066B000]